MSGPWQSVLWLNFPNDLSSRMRSRRLGNLLGASITPANAGVAVTRRVNLALTTA